jgi:hypothetical protein
MRWTLEEIVQEIIFVAMIIAAFCGLVFGWTKWRHENRKACIPVWRRILAGAGILAVTAQAIVFIESWRIGSDYVLFGKWARWVLPSFLVALPCVIAGRGASRWSLLSSSILLFVLCFFIILSA